MVLNRSLKALFVINSIFVLANNMFGPLYAGYIAYLGHGFAVAGLTYGVTFLASVFVSILLAKFGNKLVEKKYLLIIGLSFRAVAWTGYLFIDSFVWILVIQMIIGVGEGLGGPAFDAIFADHLNKRLEVNEYAEWKVVSNLTAALGSMIGGLVVTFFGFKTLFAIMSMFALTAITMAIINIRLLGSGRKLMLRRG